MSSATPSRPETHQQDAPDGATHPQRGQQWIERVESPDGVYRWYVLELIDEDVVELVDVLEW